MSRRSIADRFWSKVVVTEECWLWTAATLNGYGRFGNGARKMVTAHRWAYEFCIGPIPEGLQLDHLCRVRNCVNPDHLEPVTHQENLARVPARTHCPQGHAYDAANTRYTAPNPSTGRKTATCRTCNRDRARARAAARALVAA